MKEYSFYHKISHNFSVITTCPESRFISSLFTISITENIATNRSLSTFWGNIELPIALIEMQELSKTNT